MKCSCRKGKKLSTIESSEIEKLINFLKVEPALSPFILDLVNSFRPTDTKEIRAERIFLTVKEIQDIGLLPFHKLEELFKLLKGFFLKKSDEQRGNFLETFLSKSGPVTLRGRYRRTNQCKVFLNGKLLSNKEIDVAFSGKAVLELHECKANMGRQWRDPLSKRGKRGGKLHFLNSLPRICKGKRVVPCCTGLDGEITCKYVRKVLRFYGFRRIKVIGKRELIDKFNEKLKQGRQKAP